MISRNPSPGDAGGRPDAAPLDRSTDSGRPARTPGSTRVTARRFHWHVDPTNPAKRSACSCLAGGDHEHPPGRPPAPYVSLASPLGPNAHYANHRDAGLVVSRLACQCPIGEEHDDEGRPETFVWPDDPPRSPLSGLRWPLVAPNVIRAPLGETQAITGAPVAARRPESDRLAAAAATPGLRESILRALVEADSRCRGRDVELPTGYLERLASALVEHYAKESAA